MLFWITGKAAKNPVRVLKLVLTLSTIGSSGGWRPQSGRH